MIIKYIIEDDLNAIKNNTGMLMKDVVNGSTPLEEFLGNNDVLKKTNYNIDDFELDTSQQIGKESLTDIENIQRVYNNLKFLSDSQASDERIWVCLTLKDFLEYMRYRWKAEKIEDINNRYLFGYSVQRSLFRNGISRLWWIGRVTYDSNRADPYELTKFLCKDQDYIESICGRNVFNNPDIIFPVIDALCDAEKNGVSINRQVVRELGKYLNLVAGTYLIDVFDKKEIYHKVKSKLGF